MSSVFETLKERGYIAQLTHEEKIKELLEKEKLHFISDLIPLPTVFMWDISCR